MLCGLLIAVGTFFGFKRDTRNFEISKNLNIFNSVFRELDICYVDTVDPEKSIEAGINYMLSQLDPYTVYYPESKKRGTQDDDHRKVCRHRLHHPIPQGEKPRRHRRPL